MEISNFDKAIKESIEKVVSSPEGKPNKTYCGWLPSMRTKSGVVLQSVKYNYPALIHYIEEKTVQQDNWNERTVEFYLVNPHTNDVLETRAIHDLLESFMYKFQENLSDYYVCEFIGSSERLIDQLPILEAGIFFTLKINADKEC